MSVTNSQILRIRRGLSALYESLSATRQGNLSRVEESLDLIRGDIEGALDAELYLEDLHPDLDPPDNNVVVQPFDHRLREWLDGESLTALDWYNDPDVQHRAEAALQQKFDDRGRAL